MYGESLWQKTAQLPTFSSLQGDETATVAIVGGGLCGLLTAYRLYTAGITDLVLLEATTLCSGMTARTTAKITAQHGALYASLYRDHPAWAAAYAAHNQAAVQAFREIVRVTGTDCDLVTCDHVLYAREEADVPKLAAEHTAMRTLGMDVTLDSGETELPFEVRRVLRLSEQASFHPLKFAAGLTAWLADRGVRFYTGSPVRYPASRDGVLRTPYGTLRANTVLLTTHYPLADRRGLYFTQLYQQRGYLLSLKNVPPMTHMYRSIRSDGWSLRGWQNQLLLGFGSHRSGRETTLDHLPLAETLTTDWYPGRRITAVWATQDVMTHDSLPYIGRYPAAEGRLSGRVLVSTGFNGWGMTGSMVAAGVLQRLVLGTTEPDDACFLPSRHDPGRKSASFLKENAAVAAHFCGGWLAALPHAARLLPPDEGGIFRVGGTRLGLYRDAEGALHAVRPVCPHLGCPLQWNREERSWDCPCHGSRFDPDGHVLNNPAQKPLSRPPVPDFLIAADTVPDTPDGD